VGKATSLRDRVRSYFVVNSKQTAVIRRPIEVMIGEVTDIKIEPTDSVLEAVILEGNLIKKFRPKYNIDWKDDKSWNYIVVTGDVFPRVITVRERELDNKQSFQHSNTSTLQHTFGPYPGLNTKATMKILRRIFKFSECVKDKGTRSKEKVKPCFYYQMGECLGVCTGEISPSQYQQKVIKPMMMFLSGNKKGLLKNLNVKMKAAARDKNFEEAGRLRDQIKALQRIQDVAMLNEGLVRPVKSPQRGVPTVGGEFNRVKIEGYDISNLGASDKVGSMVVFDNDGPVKAQYRKFNIKTVVGQSDVDCLREVLTRRLRHSEWPLPHVFLVDGGLPQVNVVRKVLDCHPHENGDPVAVSDCLDSHFRGNDNWVPVIVGIAKGRERKRNDFFIANGKSNLKLLEWIKNNKKLLIQVRDEAHRFAIAFNRSNRKLE
jgi:excinuclease ABC subunit C